MKLLFDENLSPKLPGLLAAVFPGSAHVSKDSDFQQRSLLHGHPPKVVWLRLGNCTRQKLILLITQHEQDIRALDAEPHESVLLLS
jgi:predicted nuclease of predicted toxin-antitoxin system